MISNEVSRMVDRRLISLANKEEFITFKLPIVSSRSISLYIRWQRNNKSLTRVPTQTRSNITCSDRKLRRQKGTGRARLGDASSPMLRGGAVAHGPKSTRRKLKMNKKDRVRTVLGVLGRLMENQVVFYNQVPDFNKTKELNNWLLSFFDKDDKILYITSKGSDKLLTWGNLKNVKVLFYKAINVFDLLKHSKILIDKEILDLKDSLLYRMENDN